jgi:hypothetical protein
VSPISNFRLKKLDKIFPYAMRITYAFAGMRIPAALE